MLLQSYSRFRKIKNFQLLKAEVSKRTIYKENRRPCGKHYEGWHFDGFTEEEIRKTVMPMGELTDAIKKKLI